MKQGLVVMIVLAWFCLQGEVQTSSASASETVDLTSFSLAEGVTLELVAQQPQIVTPIGMDRAENGELYVVLSHTHHRPDSYQGPQHDQIVVIDPITGRQHTYYEGTTHTTHLRVGQDGWVYVMERNQMSRLRDADGDGKAEVRQLLFRLLTVTEYPHNGLGDLQWHPDGGMVFTLGENFGEAWDLVGTGSPVVSGTGEGGVFYARRDGSGLRRLAKGFWNPFGVEVTEEGEIFVAENDPGSRPPCRLLYVVEGADYGFQWNYGRDPFHPFVAWNGELRGTLGMIRPVGEGPSSIRQLGGGMMVPSWSQHKVEYFPLTRHGQSFKASRKVLIQGPEDFRPVSLVRADATTFYMTDWVSGDYAVHGQGKVWKMTLDPALASWIEPQLEPMDAATRRANDWRKGLKLPSLEALFKVAQSQDPYEVDAALNGLAQRLKTQDPKDFQKWNPERQLVALVALRRGDLKKTAWLNQALHQAKLRQDEALGFEALRWIADAGLTDYENDVAALLKGSVNSYKLFEAALACLNTLQGQSRAGLLNADVLWSKLQDPAYSAATRTYLLRLMPDQATHLKESTLLTYLDSEDADFRVEAVRKLAGKLSDTGEARLIEMLGSPETSQTLKLEILPVLATYSSAKSKQVLQEYARHKNLKLQDEAQRALRFAEGDVAFQVPAGRPPMDALEAWMTRLEALPGPRDLERGRRLFFHPRVARCASCHRYEGRGGVLGPDLSLVAQQGDARWILDSILHPGREVAPQFYPSRLDLVNGETFLGILLRSSHVDVYRNLAGKEQVFKKEEVRRREELPISLMPPGLVDTMNDEELADLLAFLTQNREKRPPQ